VQLELSAALARPPWRGVAVELQQQMDSDPEIEVAPLSEALFQAAFELFRAREDKSWSLTDCVSFTLMHERAITAFALHQPWLAGQPCACNSRGAAACPARNAGRRAVGTRALPALSNNDAAQAW